MVAYMDLTDYEKTLINECVIPNIKPELGYIEFRNALKANYSKDHTPPNNYLKEYNDILKKIVNFLMDNDFIIKRDGRFDKGDKAESLRRTGNIQKYFEAEFTNAAQIIEEYELERKTKEHNLEYLKSATNINKWLLRARWWPHGIAALSLCATAVASIYTVRAYKLTQQQQQQSATKEELRMLLQSTKNEILHQVDSAYQTKRSVAPTKKK